MFMFRGSGHRKRELTEASGSFCWFDINIEVLAEIGDNGNRRGL